MADNSPPIQPPRTDPPNPWPKTVITLTVLGIVTVNIALLFHACRILPGETLAAISERVHELVGAQHRCFLDEIQPLLAAEGVRILRPEDLDKDQRRFLDQYFRQALLPVVTPLAIDPGHPFPHLANRSLCLVASIRPVMSSLLPHASLAVVHIPGLVVPRFVALPAPPGQYAFVLLEDVIRLHLPLLYNGYEVISCHAIRVTRDAEFEVKRGRADDLLTSIEQGLRERRMGDAVRLQCEAGLPDEVRAALVAQRARSRRRYQLVT